ncbi:MAG: PIN domain-containing protein [Vicinamibacteria bacterium]
MRGVDTNVLVRFLVGDDPVQESRAASLFARATAEGEKLFVPQIVVCELVWVLGYAYAKGRAEIAAGLETLLRARQLTFEEVGEIRGALERFAAGDGDLADWLIWERSRAAGAERVVTFDARLLRSPEFAEV